MHKQTPTVEGLWVRTSPRFDDNRGWLCPALTGEDQSLNIHWILQNISRSKHRVLRGLHYQAYNAQNKLITVISGEIQDIVADLRPDSPTYGQFCSYTLSACINNQIFVPKGCAHGFLVISQEDAIISYLSDNPYTPDAEKTLPWNHPEWGFPWEIPNPILSPKDSPL